VSAAAHVPHLAAGAADSPPDGPRRSLVLAGGGMRVAYQAGVMVALEEAGLTFAHADGTSGGTMNLAMLLSGLSPKEMCERWRTLKLTGFMSPLPLRDYLRGPPFPGLGGSGGIRRRVYPHLGIDVDRIRRAGGIDGTFNVCNFTRKVNEAVHHREVDMDLLIAGVSLPIFSPAVKRGGETYLDSVWIKDANVLEAVRRGCDEVWVVWCIGNSGVYRNGAFLQYVHMIELSANGSLAEDLGRIAEGNAGRERPVRVHVIRPEWPLPLDPDFFFGRIDAATLIALGYRDACRYLDSMDDGGVPLDHTSALMRDPRPGIAWRLALNGGDLSVRACAEVEDLNAFERGEPALAVGDVSHPELGQNVLARSGSVAMSRGGHVRWELIVRGRRLVLEQQLAAGGLERLRSATRAQATLHEGSGADSPVVLSRELRARMLPLLMSVHARGVGSALAGARTVGRFARIAGPRGRESNDRIETR
jgi:hypothetical protein